jgi:hypothetical protein
VDTISTVDPDNLTAVATVWGVLVAGVVGLVGIIIGIVGLVQASQARSAVATANMTAKDALTAARRSNKIAEDALESARESNRIADEALNTAGESNKIAEEANAISRDANALSGEANEMVKAGETRATERHDVTWVCWWSAPGIYRVRNEGRDTAYAVRVIVEVDDEEVEANAEEIGGGEHIELSFPRALAQWEREERADAQHSAVSPRSYSIPPSIFDPFHRAKTYIRDRVYWSTAQGTQKSHDRGSHNNRLSP